MTASALLQVAATAVLVVSCTRAAPIQPAPQREDVVSLRQIFRCGGPEAPPDAQPGWRWTSEQTWLNDISGVSCRPGDALGPIPPSGPATYRATFETGSANWHTLSKSPNVEGISWRARDGEAGPHIVSQGPWWLDTNNGPPGGAGDLNLVAFFWVRDLVPNAHARSIDLRRARVLLRLRSDNTDLKGAHLLFWIQAKPDRGTKAVNLALTGMPLDQQLEPGRWTTIELVLPDDPAQWTCLGATLAKADLYGCADVNTVLSDVNVDLGLILFPVSARSTPTATPDPSRYPMGSIAIAEVAIDYQLRSR